MTFSTIEESQLTAERIAGLACPISFVTVVAVNFGIFARLMVRGNPAETARNIMAHETLFRIGVAGHQVFRGGFPVRPRRKKWRPPRQYGLGFVATGNSQRAPPSLPGARGGPR